MNFLAAFLGSFFVGRKQRRQWEEEMNSLLTDMERREDEAFHAGFHQGYDAGYDDAFKAMRDMDREMARAEGEDDEEFDDEYEDFEDEETENVTAANAPLTQVPAWQPLFDERMKQRQQNAHGSARKRRTKNKTFVPGPWGGTEPRKDSIDG